MSDRVPFPPAREITKETASMFVIGKDGIPQPYDDDRDHAGFDYETFMTLDGKTLRIPLGRSR